VTHAENVPDALQGKLNDMLGAAEAPWDGPAGHYNKDGDCIEIYFERDNYRAVRVDDLLTVYKSRSDGRLVGALIKGAKRFVRRLVEVKPGASVDFPSDSVNLSYILTAAIWENPDKDQQKIYIELREAADDMVVDWGQLETA